MKFSASVAVAATAIFAGQTLADCAYNGKVKLLDLKKCLVHYWGSDCGDGTNVRLDGETYTLTSGGNLLTALRVHCPAEPESPWTIVCDPHSTINVRFVCKNQSEYPIFETAGTVSV
ncbi:hypothetical protein E4U42_005696 [Claviceps africana]|uniref:Cyanovirin-N domain-containing protein n=1 Tax=Claviceps africana TaxID=83212 RepID=A0A8K0J678_9HYPO|nr:hypothetical protein E4U42_005696 [Claviceps africana]